ERPGDGRQPDRGRRGAGQERLRQANGGGQRDGIPHSQVVGCGQPPFQDAAIGAPMSAAKLRFQVDSRLATLLSQEYTSTERALKELVDNAWDAAEPYPEAICRKSSTSARRCSVS